MQCGKESDANAESAQIQTKWYELSQKEGQHTHVNFDCQGEAQDEIEKGTEIARN